MFSHDRIWAAIDRLAEAQGYSTSGLAKRAGLDPTSFNRSKRFTPEGKPRWPSTESISRVLSVTGATLTEFMSLADPQAATARQESGDSNETMFIQAPLRRFAAQDMVDATGQPIKAVWDNAPLPAPFNGDTRNICALLVDDASWHTVYRTGDMLLCAPDAPLRTGDRAAVLRITGGIWLCDVTESDGITLALQSLSVEKTTFHLRRDQLRWAARIIWASQ